MGDIKAFEGIVFALLAFWWNTGISTQVSHNLNRKFLLFGNKRLSNVNFQLTLLALHTARFSKSSLPSSAILFHCEKNRQVAIVITSSTDSALKTCCCKVWGGYNSVVRELVQKWAHKLANSYEWHCNFRVGLGLYIGQTQRNLINRIEEHRTSLSSAVCRHLQANPDHRVDFHNPEVIGSDNNWRRVQILESLLIQEHKPELNANIPSMPLCIFNL